MFVNWIPGGSHVEITCIATTDLAGRKVVRPSGIKTGSTEGAVTASPAVWAGSTLYLSALPGAAANGDSPSASVGDQVRRMAKGHVEILDQAGLKPDDIISGFVYLSDMKDYDAMNTVYKDSPARSRGPNLPDAGLRHRQDRRACPRLIHRGADALVRARTAADFHSFHSRFVSRFPCFPWFRMHLIRYSPAHLANRPLD